MKKSYKYTICIMLAAVLVTAVPACSAENAVEKASVSVAPENTPAAAPSCTELTLADVSDYDVLDVDMLTSGTQEEIISDEYAALGIVRVCYESTGDKKIKLRVQKDENTIYYNLTAAGGIEVFPLQYGSGRYEVTVLENLYGDRYSVVTRKKFNAKIGDENTVFLHSVQNIDWNTQKEAVQYVKMLISGILNGAVDNERPDEACNGAVYDFTVNNITYDYDKLSDLVYNYLPDIDETFNTGRGICYDYASLLAAMLRSIGIPAKLVKGYPDYMQDTYHAWNEVYIAGKWIVIDTTYDAVSDEQHPPAAMQKDAGDYMKVYEY